MDRWSVPEMKSQLAAILFYGCMLMAIWLECRKSTRTGKPIGLRSPVFWPIWLSLGLFLLVGTNFVIDWIVGGY